MIDRIGKITERRIAQSRMDRAAKEMRTFWRTALFAVMLALIAMSMGWLL